MNRQPGLTSVLVRRMISRMVPLVGIYWAIMLAIYVLLVGVLAATGVLERSMWEPIAGPPPRYWLLSMGVLTAVQVRLFIANGITRRQHAEASALLYLALAVLFAAIAAVGYAAERPIYEAAGLMDRLTEPYPVHTLADMGGEFVAGIVINYLYLLSGALIGIGFYRFNWMAGIAFIPLALIPPTIAEVAFDAHWSGTGINDALDLPRAPFPVGLAIAAVMLAIFLAGTYRIFRTVPVRPATSR